MKNRLKDYGSQVLNNHIKYQPNSTSVKPVHIANGLFRLVVGESYTIEALNEWIIRWKYGKEVSSAKEIRAKYSQAFDEQGFDDDEINKLRHFLNILFNADNSAYPSAHNTVLTISSKTQVRSSVPPEASMHKFLFDLLSVKVDNQISPCLSLIKSSLENQSDDISRVAEPLTNYAAKKSLDHAPSPNTVVLDGVEKRIRRSFDNLAENERTIGNKLLTLERIVIFGCFAIINHLSSRILDMSSEFNTSDRIPMLLDADGSLHSIKYASEETLLIAKRMVEEFFEKGLEEILRQEGYHKYTHEEILLRIKEMRLEDSSKRTTNRVSEEEKRESYTALYLGYYEQYKNPFLSFIKATRFKLFSDEYNTDPPGFISTLGGKIALLAPRGQGSGRKRYSPDPLILEILLLSVLQGTEQRTLGEFAEILWERYGVIIGANPETDYERLSKWRVSQITPGDLAGDLSRNAEKIADLLISMGYGKRYADGVTVIYLRR